jgi:tRNA(Ile2) C34 agmatinyltransferase TiaS
MILAGIDDTDTLDSPGTNKVARQIVAELTPEWHCRLIVRHQLLFDPRVPYTSKNSSASLWFEPRCSSAGSSGELHDRICRALRERFVPGSDPGVCVVETVPDEVAAFGLKCQQTVVGQQEARRLAARHGILLSGLGGTEDGVIGALAAVGLASTGNDGRVVQIEGADDDLCDEQSVETLAGRGISGFRCAESSASIAFSGRDRIDIGKHLRPNLRDHRVVLFVEQVAETGLWRAVRRL